MQSPTEFSPAAFPKSKAFQDLTGLRFGKLTAIAFGGTLPQSNWLCNCDCGIQTVVAAASLKAGRTSSCGCVHRESIGALNKTHGGSKHPLYKTWINIKQRTMNPDNTAFKNYMGRGIGLCERWLDFANFLSDMGERPSSVMSIDRIDNNGPYSPENCRWSSISEQNNNTRRTVKITHDGETRSMAEWSRHMGFSSETVRNRIKSYGWTEKQAITVPFMRLRRKLSTLEKQPT